MTVTPTWKEARRRIAELAAVPGDPTDLGTEDRAAKLIEMCGRLEKFGRLPARVIDEGPAVVLRDGRTVSPVVI